MTLRQPDLERTASLAQLRRRLLSVEVAARLHLQRAQMAVEHLRFAADDLSAAADASPGDERFAASRIASCRTRLGAAVAFLLPTTDQPPAAGDLPL